MYEVEFKVELTLEEKEQLIGELKKSGFTFMGVTPQNDYYIEAKKSDFGGYDLKRYRNEAGKYIYTEKLWELVDDKPIRRENENEVSKEIFESTIARYPNSTKVIKDREWFKGSYQSKEISVTIDTVKFDHSPKTRYFVEAEIDVADKYEVEATKVVIQDFLKEILHKEMLIDSPGMFMMAFEKR